MNELNEEQKKSFRLESRIDTYFRIVSQFEAFHERAMAHDPLEHGKLYDEAFKYGSEALDLYHELMQNPKFPEEYKENLEKAKETVIEKSCMLELTRLGKRDKSL